jgi:tetratricopeptide (TPR) repeat protein
MPTGRPRSLALLGLVTLLVAGCASSTSAGRVALNQGRPDQAAVRFEEALAENPDNVDALVGLGVARYRLGDHPSAIANLEQAVSKQPDQAVARLYLALAYLHRGDDAAAVGQLAALQALPLHPRFAVHVARTVDLLRGPRLPDPIRAYVAADLEDAAGWAREVAELRQAVVQAQLWADPYFVGPYYMRFRR